jgi:cyclophilin family peptidyl-prolyl cis-trans isomerase
MEMDVNAAPLTARHFVQLALKDHYYDGLSFHRVVPNFVIQGGSPGANEYAGQKDFMRDEISALNEVGSVGLSTRGRNTGDAQFFVNLVTNTRLDYDYTIFAHVFPNDMRIVYDVEEGDEIAAISQVDCEPK